MLAYSGKGAVRVERDGIVVATLGAGECVGEMLRDRKFQFDIEAAIYLTVLHRLIDPGSDRAAEKWRQEHALPESAMSLDLHQLYRAMAWLGETLPDAEQKGRTPFAPRCVKDALEERLFERRKDLFTEAAVVFFDTTSIYFEGKGGATLGRHGHSKDHRPDLHQMVVGLVLDSGGRPVCCELWPGNTTDVKSLVPIVDRLRERFHISEDRCRCARGRTAASRLIVVRRRNLVASAQGEPAMPDQLRRTIRSPSRPSWRFRSTPAWNAFSPGWGAAWAGSAFRT